MDDRTGDDSRGFRFLVEEKDAGRRLDILAARRLPDCSRTAAAELIRNGRLTVDGACRKPGYRVRTGEAIAGTQPRPEPPACLPEPIDLSVLYEDDDLLAIDKPPGLVVHPAPGHPGGTVVNALLHRWPEMAAEDGDNRPGIVHRLDKDTSGILLVAKSPVVQRRLSADFKARRLEKTYLALVHGCPEAGSGTIALPIGRHPVDRKRMSTISAKPREALTRWRLRQRLHEGALLEIDLKTGRTHQIRVHCAAVGHPVMGDAVYGNRKGAGSSPAPGTRPSRQMLHAWRLRFRHPVDGRTVALEAPLPRDMAECLEALGGRAP